MGISSLDHRVSRTMGPRADPRLSVEQAPRVLNPWRRLNARREPRPIIELSIMKKPSYLDVLADRERLVLTEHILGIAVTDQPDATYRHRDGRDVYIWRAY